MAAGTSILGTRVLRTEDPSFLTRGAVYTDDIVDDRLTGAVYVTFVRSPVAHGRIVSIDKTAALAAEGVVDVVTAEDLEGVGLLPPPPGSAQGKQMRRSILAADVVRFVGEPVAAVVTQERYQGEDAAELVGVDIEPLPAVVDPREAAKDEVLLFPDAGTNTTYTSDRESDPTMFDDCEVVVTQEVINQRVAAVPLEVRAMAAAAGADGRLVVWAPSQGAQGFKSTIVRVLKQDEDQVHVVTPEVGGGFGAKIFPDAEHLLVPWLAKRLDRPVRWVETRSENLLAMPQGRGQIQTVTIGGRRDGTVQAYRLDVLQDSGCGGMASVLASLTALMAPGVYDIAKVEANARSVATNTAPVAAFRGAGRPEATAAVERAMDLFAAEIGMDPADVRRKNVVAPDKFPFRTSMGALYDSGEYAAALDKVLAGAGYEDLRREQQQRRDRGDVVQLGLGMSTYVEITGGGLEASGDDENATVEIHADGSATVLTGTSPHGQGHATAWAMLVSEQTGIPLEKVTVKHGDTDLIPKGGGTGGSRSLQLGGSAVFTTTQQLVELAKERAAALLEANPDDLVVDTENAGLGVVGTPGTSVSFADLAAKEELRAEGVFAAPGPTYPFGAHLAAVEVDTESGKVVLRRLVTVDDAGTVLNPLLFDGQRHGGLAQGVAQALFEEVLYDEDGNPQTTTFADYPIVSATELPSFELLTMETPTSYNPLGAKGIGEAATIGSTPAVQNAVVDALAHLGVRHVDMPLTPERVWSAVTAAGEGNA
ncbi:MAG: molybdopterin-dependent oxidoreductase [Streptosporangiales bacterium]|nr:molybdopterin-dependent oxidoreductase [Streptosporangiales bacterium]